MDIFSLDFLMVFPFFVGLGCFVGFIAGLLGVGGGAILVPALYYIGQHFYAGQLAPEVLMHTALGTAMAIIIPTGLSSSRAQIKRGAVDWDAFRALAPALVAGVVFGIFVVSGLKSAQLQLIFAIGLYFLSALIFFKKEGGAAHPVMLRWFWASPSSALIGIFSTLVGIGGATLNVPYLSRAGVSLHRAIATSSVLGVVISVPAAIGFMVIGDHSDIGASGFIGFVNVVAWGLIFPFSVLCAPLGVRASHAMPVKKLKTVFAVLLILIASKMLFEVLG
ncbi:MAG: sulfite exporter TauE/SafE family protein [Alphaproteobacteria bacterium]|nr:sulfite exporter TauE/SafE family protein [Alphaproteobacteria bacterium]